MNITSTVIGKQDQFELRKSFIKWQCRVRQIAMRENGGKPDEGIIPIVKLETSSFELGSVVTLIHKLPKFSVTAELIHMSKKTMDPAQRRDQAVRFLSSAYYQRHAEFSDLITATFEPTSRGAKIILQEAYCILMFEAFSQRYDLHCTVRLLKKGDPFYESTFAHNSLFNANIHPRTLVLGFEPNWAESSSRNSFAY